MKKSICILTLSGLLMILLACGPAKEVDYSKGSTTRPNLDSYFGQEAYVPDIETFMQIGWNGSPYLSPDGNRIYFENSISGVTQLYLLNNEGWPYQLTQFPDGIDWYSFSHSGDLAIVGASIGGSENSQMYLIDAYSGRAKQLTDNSEFRFGSVVWGRDDNTIYYRSNIANGRDFKLYKMDVATGESTLLIDVEGFYGWADISLDGTKLLYYRFDSNVNDDIYIYDITSGESDYLTPHEGEILYDNFFFSADGTKIYLTSNDNEQGINRRAVMDISSKEISFIGQDTKWNVEGVSVNPERTVMAWIINEEGYGRLKLAEIANDTELPVPQLDGIVADPALSNTSRMLFTFNNPTQTTDVWSWDWRHKSMEKLTFSSYAGIDNEIFKDPRLIKYESFDGLEIPAFLYLPANYTGGPIPFILDMHGGPEGQFRPYFNRHFQYFMLHGFGLLAPNVRGSDGYGKDYLAMDNYKDRLKSVRDMKEGAQWLIDNGYSAKGMIGVKGGSYGGYMTMAAITEYPDLFSAACNDVGIVNFVSFLENTSSYRRALREAEYGPLTDTTFLHSISPINKANLIKTPLMVVHGENDPRVPVGEAHQIIDAIQKRGGVVEPLIFPDEGHGVAKLQNRLVFYRRMVDFFKKHLKK